MGSLSNPRKLLAAIGVQFDEKVDAESFRTADIEQALLEGARAVFKGDLRVTNPLFTWVEKNGEYINTERLKKLLKADSQPESLVWIHALAFFGLSLGQHRWKILAAPQKSAVALRNTFQTSEEALEDARTLQRIKGELHWAQETGFTLASTSIRTSSKYALDTEPLAKLCPPFGNRLLFGPNWRADIVSAIQNGARTPKEVRLRTGCSQEPANRILREMTQLGLLLS